jgi:hypothetical protein
MAKKKPTTRKAPSRGRGVRARAKKKSAGRRVSAGPAAARVARAEKELGVKLPRDYRDFMVKHNGATPKDSFFVFQRKRRRAMNWISSLCRIAPSKIDPGNLRGANELRDRCAAEGAPVPAGCIVIGYDASDEFILLFVEGKRKNEVWLRLLEDTNSDPAAKPDPEEGMYKLAPSFGRFLKNLRSEEEVEGL